MASFALRGRVALIRIKNPPVNSLGFAARKGIADGLDEAEKAGATAVVISGDGATFPAGADIKEFASGGHMKSPALPELVQRVASLNMHTVAAIHGTALGGGMELTLACQYRLMHEHGKLGLPEVHLGLLPGAGGTQLLPRIVGCEAAINLMTTGKMVKIEPQPSPSPSPSPSLSLSPSPSPSPLPSSRQDGQCQGGPLERPGG